MLPLAVLAAVVVPAVVALPPGAVAPAPGALPPNAVVQALDPELGLARVDLPARGAEAALARLRRAPGTRYVERLADGTGCGVGSPRTGPSRGWWSSAIHLQRSSADGVLIGIADSGFDRERLGVKMDGESFVGGDVFQDELGHGTLVASLAAGNRRDLDVRGVAAGAELRVAKIATTGKCRLALTLIKAFKYFRQEGVSVVNVSATLEPTQALRDELRALQLSGALVVAAVGNSGGVLGRDTFPWAEPGVIGVGALSRRSAVAESSTRSRDVDIVAPGPGVPAIASSSRSPSSETMMTPDGSSFAAPLVAGAAALIRAEHRTWDPARVAAALRKSADKLDRGMRPNRAWGWGRLNVREALKVTPPADRNEPNDWIAAGRLQPPLLTPATASYTLTALIGAGDPFDVYPLQLAAGDRVRVRLRAALKDVDVWLMRPGAPTNLLDNRAAGASAAWRSWTAAQAVRTPGAAESFTLPSARAGTYLVVVAARQGAGPYSLTLTRTPVAR